VPDLRGYGDSDKPAEDDPFTYSKRTMAQDVVNVMRALGHEGLAIVGHDRGALVAVRAGLGHREAITHIGILDVCRRWTPGMSCTASTRRSPGTCTSWPSPKTCRKG
jgi:pimeloyl-ACP methyl ester carboxylesterase